MKKIIIAILLISFSAINIYSQTDTVLNRQQEIEESLSNLQKGLEKFQNQVYEKKQQVKIWKDSIASFEKKIHNNIKSKKYQKSIDSLKKLVANNEKMIKALNKGIEDITKSIIELNEEVDTEEQEFSDDFYNDYDNYDYQTRDKKKFRGNWWGIQLGLNNFANSDFSPELPQDAEFLSVNQSKSWEFCFNPFQINLPFFNRYVGAVTGIGFKWNNYELSQNVNLTVDDNGNLQYFEPENYSYDKNRFKTWDLTLPFIIEFQIPVNKKDKRIYFSAGVVGNMNLQTKMKTIFVENNTEKKQKDKSSNWPINKFNYFYTARFGFNAFFLYLNYSGFPLFDKNYAPEIHTVSFGLGISI